MKEINFQSPSIKELDVKLTSEKLGKILYSLNVNISDLAVSVGVSRNAIYKWINGKSCISMQHLYKISQYIGVPIDDLMVGVA